MNRKNLAVFVLAAVLALTACGRGDVAKSTAFPSVNRADLPDVLEVTAGTLGDVYFTSFGPSGDCDYRSFLGATFEHTTQADYAALLDHYRSSSIGTDENGDLLFEWGRLRVSRKDDAITINAYMS